MFSRSIQRHFKVSVLGAAGGIGQPLCLLLKKSPLVSSLSCYDIVNAKGVAADLSHISTPAKVSGYAKDEVRQALDGCDVVAIPAGVPRKPGMTRDDLFNTNATIVRNLVSECATACPKAMILIISNPVNSTVPIASEVLKRAGVYDPRKLVGVTTLDIVRAKTFLAEELQKNPFDINVTVVGGHSGATIVPLFSQTGFNIPIERVKELTYRVQFGGDEVVKAKDGAGSATLSMAFAGAEFVFSILKALRGDKGITECAFVECNVRPNVPFFSTRVTFGKHGLETAQQVGTVSSYEEELLRVSDEELIKNINKGIEFGKKA